MPQPRSCAVTFAQLQSFDAQRIEVHVDTQIVCPAHALNQAAAEAALKQWANPTVPTVIPSAVAYVQPVHCLAQIRIRGLQQKVVMVSHAHIAMHEHAKPFRQLRQQVQKVPSVFVVGKDSLPVDTARGHVVPPISRIDSKRSCHDQTLSLTHQPLQA